jgi:hypothetical protein
MNFGMIDVLVGSHAGDIRRQIASRRTVARGRESWPAAGVTGRPGLRSRIGFALVEVGLRLQVTASPMHGSGRIRLNQRSYR